MSADDPEPHRWLADRLRDLVHSGDLPPGAALRKPDLAAQYEVPVAVVTRALRVLLDEGLLVHRQEVGATVAAGSPASLAALRRLLVEADALLAQCRSGGGPADPDQVDTWRRRARAAGALP